MITPIPDLLPQREIITDFRFGVFFFAGGVVPNPLDIRFKKVSGLSATVRTRPLPAGGQNLYTQKLPEGVEYGNLVLERGFVMGSPLQVELQAALSLFKFAPSNVVVMLFNDASVPVAAWSFFKAYPVKWAVSDLDAESNGVLIDTLELAYARMQIMRV